MMPTGECICFTLDAIECSIISRYQPCHGMPFCSGIRERGSHQTPKPRGSVFVTTQYLALC